jgi:hypothetical protein
MAAAGAVGFTRVPSADAKKPKPDDAATEKVGATCGMGPYYCTTYYTTRAWGSDTCRG